jgi:protein SCO1
MRKFIAILTATVGLLIGCKKAETSAPSAAADPSRKVYKARGVVKEFEGPTRAQIAHEKIPDYMEAMTMGLEVKNANEFAGVKVGDQIAFDMVVTKDDGWIENVRKIGGGAPVVENTLTNSNTNLPPNVRVVRNVPVLNEGDLMTDYPLVTEEGKKIRLSDFKGQALAFSFIFTRCPFPTYCPRMNSNFEKAAQELAKPSNPTNWHFLSISFDTDVDTPEVLKKYAGRYERPAAKWNFVTSDIAEIDAITQQFGLIFTKATGTINHNLRTVIVDAAGRVQKIYIGNEWTVEEFVEEMKKAAAMKGP